MVGKTEHDRGDIRLSNNFRLGKIGLGRVMAHWWWSAQSNHKPKRYSVLYCGTVTIGMVVHHLGVIAWRDEIFLSRWGEIWKLDGVKLQNPSKVHNPVKMGDSARKVWADGIAQMVSDRLTPKKELMIMNGAKLRYHSLVSALTNERCIKAATYGRRRAPRDYAKGISEGWGQGDLLAPREPNLMHALMTSLVLALPAAKASELIKLGAWLEYRVPIFSSESAMAIYHNACWQLSRLCPTWHAESYLCDYGILGPLDQMFRNQFMRVMGVASARELPIEDVAGGNPTFGVKEPEWRTDASQTSSWAIEPDEVAQMWSNGEE